MKRQLRVGDSGIHGKGLFTTVDIQAGDLLGYCTTRPSKAQTLYTLWPEGGGPVEVTCKLKYINHARHPNVSYYADLSVIALRDIEAGEELTHHYGDDWD